ncbi:S-adenosyl-L-methionine-dependent methyltransferase, partial [Thermothelomyces heterothallicus CBS 203.75]
MRPSLVRHVPSALRTSRRAASRAPAAAIRFQQPWLQFFPSRALSTTSPARHDPHLSSASSASSSSSVNETEISHFSALASSWWDPHGPSRPLHLMNPLRHEFIQSCLASSSGLRYLDVGCGGGIFAESAARLPSTASVTAIDPSPTILAVARAHAKRDPALAGGGGGGKLTYLS